MGAATLLDEQLKPKRRSSRFSGHSEVERARLVVVG
jgi:hypothetical protein